MMESTVLTLRQQADINTAAMVARGVDTTESTTTDSTTIPDFHRNHREWSGFQRKLICTSPCLTLIVHCFSM